MPKKTIIIILLIVVGAGIAYFVRENKNPHMETEKKFDASIKNFEDCQKTGGHVLDGTPRQCHGADGRTFMEVAKTNPTPPPLPPVSANSCAKAGCSSQLCVDSKVAAETVTTCEYREIYGCYKSARCERQSNGQCGFTPSNELSLCLSQNGGSIQ